MYKEVPHFQQEKKVKLLRHGQLLATPWTVAHQAPPPMEFFRQEYWSGLPFPSPGDLPDWGIKPQSPTLQSAVTIWPNNSTLQYIFKRTKHRYSNKNLYINVHSSTINNSQQVEWTHVCSSVDERKNKMWYIHSKEYYSAIKEWSTYTNTYG